MTIQDLHVQYNKGKEVLKGLNLSLQKGMTHGLVGLNGSGKTTLLNTLFAFIKPQKGEIVWENAPLSREETAYLEADNFFYPYMSGREYLNLFPERERKFQLKEWEQLFSLPLDRITEEYSTGMKKRLALLAVIKLNKPLMILDEPFNGLDMEGTHLLTMILGKLHEQGKTILITSHIYETLTSSCDYIHYLKDGVIQHSYSRHEFDLLQEHLRQAVQGRSLDQLDRLFKDSESGSIRQQRTPVDFYHI